MARKLAESFRTPVIMLTDANLATGVQPIERPEVTDDQFVLVVEQVDASFDVPAVRELFESFHATEVEERIGQEVVE